jgi:hypothetical protein
VHRGVRVAQEGARRLRGPLTSWRPGGRAPPGDGVRRLPPTPADRRGRAAGDRDRVHHDRLPPARRRPRRPPAAPGHRHLRPPPAGDQCGRAPGRRPGRHAGRAGRPPRGLRIAAVARDQFGALLAAGLLENVHMRRYL